MVSNGQFVHVLQKNVSSAPRVNSNKCLAQNRHKHECVDCGTFKFACRERTSPTDPEKKKRVDGFLILCVIATRAFIPAAILQFTAFSGAIFLKKVGSSA